jgi:hypothetical protein
VDIGYLETPCNLSFPDGDICDELAQQIVNTKIFNLDLIFDA